MNKICLGLAVVFLYAIPITESMIPILADEPDFKKLVEMALKYDCPMPDKQAELKVGCQKTHHRIRQGLPNG